MREEPKKPICSVCADYLHYNDPIPKRGKGVMMHMGERFCNGGKKARRFKRGDPEIYVPSWCPKRKDPCELRVYTFKSVNDWWLHKMLEKSLGKSLPPEGHNHALVETRTTELSPREFWKRLECGSYQELLDVTLQPYSVVEIDDGLKPAFFLYVDGGFKLLYSFEAETARKNKKEA